MTKAPLAPDAVAVEDRQASDPKGSINLRIEAQTRALIDEAAAVLGKTRTEFMIDSARALAIDVLLDQRLFVLDFGALRRVRRRARQPAGARPQVARAAAAKANVGCLTLAARGR